MIQKQILGAFLSYINSSNIWKLEKRTVDCLDGQRRI